MKTLSQFWVWLTHFHDWYCLTRPDGGEAGDNEFRCKACGVKRTMHTGWKDPDRGSPVPPTQEQYARWQEQDRTAPQETWGERERREAAENARLREEFDRRRATNRGESS